MPKFNVEVKFLGKTFMLRNVECDSVSQVQKLVERQVKIIEVEPVSDPIVDRLMNMFGMKR